MTTVIKELRANSEWAVEQWKKYLAVARRIGDTDSLREANEGLGYNLVKTIPGLLQWIQELEEANAKLKTDLFESRAENLRTINKKIESLKSERPAGIPAEHIVLDVSDNLELEVVTEEVANFNPSQHMPMSGV